MAKPATRIQVAAAIVVLLFFLLAIGGFPEATVFIFQTGVALLFGWAPYFVRAISQAHLNWKPIALGAAYFIALLVGTHYFLRWLVREINRKNTLPGISTAITWRLSYTLRAFALLFLAFFAGMMVIGIVHQSAWLARSSKPLFHHPPRAPARYDMGNLAILGEALGSYATTHDGRYPDNLEELIRTDHLQQSYLQHSSYLYFGKGRSGGDSAAVICLDPPINHEDAGIVVLFGDGRAEWIEIDKARDILLQHGFERIEATDAAYSPGQDAAP